MSSNNISDCLCSRFPNGTAISASERTQQKANIQIFKNNVLLNCNSNLSNSNLVRRVYTGSQNRLRIINGFKLIEENKAKLNCGGNTNCIFSDKKAPDFWIINNSF